MPPHRVYSPLYSRPRRVARFVVGAGLALTVALVVMETGVGAAVGSNTLVWIMVVALALVVVLAAYKLFHAVMIVASAATGSFVAALAVSHFANGHLRLLQARIEYKIAYAAGQVRRRKCCLGLVLLTIGNA